MNRTSRFASVAVLLTVFVASCSSSSSDSDDDSTQQADTPTSTPAPTLEPTPTPRPTSMENGEYAILSSGFYSMDTPDGPGFLMDASAVVTQADAFSGDMYVYWWDTAAAYSSEADASCVIASKVEAEAEPVNAGSGDCPDCFIEYRVTISPLPETPTTCPDSYVKYWYCATNPSCSELEQVDDWGISGAQDSGAPEELKVAYIVHSHIFTLLYGHDPDGQWRSTYWVGPYCNAYPDDPDCK